MHASWTKLLLLSACLLATQVHGWGGWNSVVSSVRQVADNVGQEVKNAVHTVGREAERIGSQVGEVYHETVHEVSKMPDEVESWFVPSGGGGGGDADEPEEPGVVRVRRRGCRPLINDTVDFSCIVGVRRADCAYAQAVGTVATISCKPGYKVSEYPGFSDITCTAEFKWSKQYFTCVPDCGKQHSKIDTRSAISDQLPHLPWNIGVFKRNEQNEHHQICAGSLITPSLVLSAASCFWDSETNAKTNATQYHLLAGNQRRGWSTTDAWTQRRDVSAILLPDRFAGRVRLLANDVALVRVSEPFLVTRGVNTVCLDWINAPDESTIEDGDRGLVASWSSPDLDIHSDANIAASLNFVSFDACADTIDADFSEYLTHDKICVSADNAGADLTVCAVDTGVGYSFPLQTLKGARHYLRGVLSEPFNATSGCVKQRRALFTQFAAHLKWARPIVFDTEE